MKTSHLFIKRHNKPCFSAAKFTISCNDWIILVKKISCCLLLITCLLGCASKNTPSPGHTDSATSSATTNTAIDPYENYNRNAYRMNDKLDRWIIRPTAVWYLDYVPYPIRNTIANFYNNLRDFVTLGNDVLQLDGKSSMHNVMRISINSVFGILGLIDISTSLGLPQTKNSFGNTFKFYGWKHSSYFVIPLLGPSTVRDGIGLIPDTALNPTWYIPYPYYISVALFAVNGINTRTQFLAFDQILKTSVDPYITMRDVYLANIGESRPAGKGDVSIETLLEEEVAESRVKVPKKHEIQPITESGPKVTRESSKATATKESGTKVMWESGIPHYGI